MSNTHLVEMALFAKHIYVYIFYSALVFVVIVIHVQFSVPDTILHKLWENCNTI